MKTPKELLLELVAVKSVSETPGENAVADKLLALLRQDPYFAAHPDHCGAWDGGDRLGRPVIWGLKKGRGARTLVLSGHYDTVDTASYGALEPLALDPEALRAALLDSAQSDPALAADLEDPRWMPGRGVADMKGGLAASLHTLYGYQPQEANLLFTAVSDEENLSAGARQAVGLYAELAGRFGLDYALAVISEPTERDAPGGAPHPIIHGGAGKILPVVVARGTPEHGSYMLRGINSAHLIAGMVTQTEYDTAFVSGGGNIYTQPPAVQLMRDMKGGYDVSMPEYTACALNMTFFCQTDPVALLERLGDNCRAAAAGLAERYDACFDAMVSAGQIDAAQRKAHTVPVCTLTELEEQLAEKPGFLAFRHQAKVRCGQMIENGETMQWATICYIREVMSWQGSAQPLMVVGIAPPYYPAVHTDYLGRDIGGVLAAAAARLAEQGIATVREEYSPAMMDMSYTSCAGPDSAGRIMANIPVPRALYDMDVEAMAGLAMPTLVIGPARKDIHQIGERVWLPDIETDLPKIYHALIDSI